MNTGTDRTAEAPPVEAGLPVEPGAEGDRLSESPVLKAVRTASRRFLREQLRPPEGLLPCRWSASDADPRIFDLNELLPLTAAWREIDTAVARDLLRSAFAAQADDGSLPRALSPSGAVAADRAPWPLFAQCVRLLADREPDAAFAEDLRPRLVRYLEWAFRRFDPAGTGRPAWGAGEEALTPDTWDEGLCSADLAALLLAEVDALSALGAAPDDVAPLRVQAQRMADALQFFFWDASARVYRDRYADGRFVARRTWSAVAPLLWRGLPSASAQETIQLLVRDDHFGPRSAGVPLWEAWPDDPAPPSAPARFQALLMAGLELAERRRPLRGLRDRLRSAMEEACVERAVPPRDYHGRTPAAASRMSVESAALAMQVLAEASPETVAAPGRRWLQWVEDRRMLLAGSLAAVLLAALVILMLWFQQRTQPPGPSMEAMVGLAHNQYKRGDFTEAARICREIIGYWGEGTAGSVRFLYGNALFRTSRFAEAAEQYRLAGSDFDVEAMARFNLAQTLVRLGRRNEALSLLARLAEEHQADFPELAERARLAADFLQGRLLLPD